MTYRNFLLTLNNPDALCEDYLKHFYTSLGCRYVIGQLERGEQGTPHIQFFCNFKSGTRCAKIKKHDSRLHIEGVKINNGADKYCCKEDTRIEGPFEFGERPIERNSKADWDVVKKLAQEGDLEKIPADIYVKHYRTLKLIQKDHLKIALPTDSTKGVWICGPSGIGKSLKAREDYPNAFPKSANKWWDGYDGQEAVILDDLDTTHECLAHHLKIWADHYGAIGEIKGGAIALQFKKFVVTSLYEIEEIFKDAKAVEALHRRFKVIRLS